MKDHRQGLKAVGWGLFGLNLLLGLSEILGNLSQAVFKTLAYAYAFWLQAPKIVAVVLAGLALLLGAAELVGRIGKTPQKAGGELTRRLWLLGIVLFFLPNTFCLLNQGLDFSRPYTLTGKVSALRADYHDLAALVGPQKGWGLLAVPLSGDDYLRLRRLGAEKSDTASSGEYYWAHNELVQVIPPFPIEVYGVHRGFLGLKWQEAGAGYRLFLDKP